MAIDWNKFANSAIEGAAGGVDYLLNEHIDRMKERRGYKNRTEAYKKAFGFSDEKAKAIAHLPPSQQDLIVKEYLLREGYPQDQQQQQFDFSSQMQPQQQQQQPQMQDLMSQLGMQEPQGPQSGMDRLKSVLTEGALQELMGGGAPVNPDFGPQMSQNMSGLQPNQGQITPEFQPNIQPQPQGMKPRRLSPEGEARERLSREKMAQQERQFEARQAQSKEQFEKKELHQRQNESRGIIKELTEKKNALRSQRAALEKMKRLNDKKLIDSPEATAIRKFFHIDYDFLKSPGTREYEGMGVNFLSSLKPLFGARPTNFDVQTFLRKLASAGDTPAARRRLGKNYDLTLEAEEALVDSKEAIIRENNGIAPHDLDLQAADRARKQIDHIWKQFVDSTGTKEIKAGDIVSGDQIVVGDLIEVDGEPVRVTAQNIGSFR